MKGPEIAYNTTEKEILALVWILHKFRIFLAEGTIIHRTDHMALTFLKKCRLLNGRLMRWVLAIQDFNVRSEYCRGKENVVADALSRYAVGNRSEKEANSKKLVIFSLARHVSRSLITKL